MQRSLVMTIIGQDRPGLVDTVASRVTEHGGNLIVDISFQELTASGSFTSL
jgi:glycine cleavage system regulatory protein